MNLRLGADIGGTNSRVGAVNEGGEVICRRSFDTGSCETGADMADGIARCARDVIEAVEVESDKGGVTWAGLGLGAPSANFYTGTIEDSPNLKFKGVTPLVALLEERLDLPKILLTNDANAAALGERVYGAAKNVDDFLMITLGTGLGGGVFVAGKLVYGHTGFAGELGHITLIPEGRVCGYGRRGSFETYCSARGIVRTFFELKADRALASSLDNVAVGDISSRAIADAANAGDVLSQLTYEKTGEYLGKGLATLVLPTSPEKIFLFGGPVKAGDLLLNPTRKAFEQHIISQFAGKTTIEPSALEMGDAAILGAAGLLA